MEVDATRYDDLAVHEEKTQAVLARLQSLKRKVSELRAQCEALKLQSKKQIEALVCSACGRLIKEGSEVTVKDTLGVVKSYYHEDCFRKILSS